MNNKLLLYLALLLYLSTVTASAVPAKEVIIQNRKTIQNLKIKVSELETRLSGMVSLIEGINKSIAELKVHTLTSTSTSNSDNNNSDNTALIKDLGAMIDNINNSYVTKDDLARALSNKSTNKSPENNSKKSVDNKNSSVYGEGVRLYGKKRYDEAAKRFIISDRKGYKPAASNYYLGEISYYTKMYEDAIFYYKKSVSLYDQAGYMDVLLLHTATSLEKTGDNEQAKIFYKNIVDNYPNKKSATIAKNKLKNL